MCYGNDGGVVMFSLELVIARKDHRCTDCGQRTIIKGERYERATGTYEGDFFASKVCHRCLFQRAWVIAHEVAIEGCDKWDACPPQGDTRKEYQRLMGEQREAVAHA